MPPGLLKFRAVEREYRPILLLTSGGLFYVVGYSVVWFTLPIVAENMSGNLFHVGVLMAIPSLIALVFDIPFGGFSHHIGRKRVFTAGLVLMALLGFALPSVDTLTSLIIFLVLFGFGGLSTIVPMRAYVMDVSPPGKTSVFFGVFETMTQAGMALGSFAGGYLLAEGLDVGVSKVGVFYFLAAAASATALLTVKETVPSVKSLSDSFRAAVEKDRLYIKSLMEYRQLHYPGFAVLVATFTVVFVDGLVWTLEPLYTTEGIDSETVGLILAMFILPFVLFEVPAGVLADRVGKTGQLISGLLVAGMSLIVFGRTTNPETLMASAFLASTGLALARPAMDGFLADISSGKGRGGIAGVWNIAEDAAYVAGPIAGGAMAELYGLGTALIITGLAVMATIPLIHVATKQGKKTGDA